MTAQYDNSFLPCSVPRPVAPSKIAGISNPNASIMPDGRSPEAGANATVGAVVLTVRVAVPTPLATVTVPTEQVGAGLAVGLTLQVKLTVDESNPFVGVIVTAELVEAPAAIEDGVSAAAASEKSATMFIAFDVLVA